MNKIFNENDIVNNLTSTTEKVEMLENLKNQIKEARKLRIKEIEQIVKKLPEIIKSKENEIKLMKDKNKKIEETEEYKNIANEYAWKSFVALAEGSAKDSVYKMTKGYEKIEQERVAKLEEIGYISDIEEKEKEILESKKNLPIKYLYKKYLCDIFGHEYKRYKGKIDYEVEGGRRARYSDEDLNMYDERELIEPGFPGTRYAVCKYCGEKIEELEHAFPLDCVDLQKVNIIFEKRKVKSKKI